MKYKRVPEIDKDLSLLTYGTPHQAADGFREEGLHCYDLAWEAGFRTFDTAHSYGTGEEVLGEWLETRGHRNEAVIIDKGCDPGQQGIDDVFSAKTIRDQIEESLIRLRTDHVEFYILHRDDPRYPVDEIVEELNKLKKEGKVIRFGGSNWTMERFKAANAYADAHGLTGFSALEPAYSLAVYTTDPWGGSVSISGPAQADYRKYLAEEKIPVFPYSATGRGYLSGKFRTDGNKPIEECLPNGPIWEYDCPENRARLARAEKLAAEKGVTVPQIAIAWLLHEPMEIFPLLAPTTKEHIADTVKVFDLALTDAECSWLLDG